MFPALKVFKAYVFQSVTFDMFVSGFLWSVAWYWSIPYSTTNAHLHFLNYVNWLWCIFIILNCVVCYYFLIPPHSAAFSMYVGTLTPMVLYIFCTGGVRSPFIVNFVLVAIALAANSPKLGYSIIYAMGSLVLLLDFLMPLKYPIPEAWRYTVYTTNFVFILLLFYIKYIPYFLQQANQQYYKKSRGVYYNGPHMLTLDYSCRVGNGAYGKVYRGVYKNEDVAVKEIVAPEKGLASEEKKSLRNIEREIKILSSLSSPYIVRYIDKGTFIVMELCESDLTKYLTENAVTLSVPQLIAMMREMVSGLIELHSRNILHRDLKSPNILLNISAENEVTCKLGDFGASIVMSNTSDTMISLKKMRGSIMYLGPEFWYSTGEVASVYSDIFSLGMIVWEMFYAWATKKYQSPFLESKKKLSVKHTYKTNLLAILTLVCNGSRPVIPKNFPIKILKLFRKCVATETHYRPQASEILIKLEKWLLKGDFDEWELNNQEFHLKLDPICYFKKTDVVTGNGENFSFNKSSAQ